MRTSSFSQLTLDKHTKRELNMSRKIIVREPRFPIEGEYTLDHSGKLVVYKDGEWVAAGHE
tara:strand:+ start:54 stop:236 length:183 start_codon:yes stop_codon:yes gene_type:complete